MLIAYRDTCYGCFCRWLRQHGAITLPARRTFRRRANIQHYLALRCIPIAFLGAMQEASINNNEMHAQSLFRRIATERRLYVLASMDYAAEIARGSDGLYACDSKEQVPYAQVEGVCTPRFSTSDRGRPNFMGRGPPALDQIQCRHLLAPGNGWVRDTQKKFRCGCLGHPWDRRTQVCPGSWGYVIALYTAQQTPYFLRAVALKDENLGELFFPTRQVGVVRCSSSASPSPPPSPCPSPSPSPAPPCPSSPPSLAPNGGDRISSVPQTPQTPSDALRLPQMMMMMWMMMMMMMSRGD